METAVRDTTAPGADQNVRERRLIAVVGELARELHPQHARPDTISLSSRLERDLGIDSLGRTELVLRLERAFGVRLSINLVGEANSVGDLWQALEQAGQTGATIAAAPAPPSLGAVSAAAEASTLLEVLEWHVAHNPDRLHLAVLEDDSTILGTLSYGELAKQSRGIAAGLVERDIMPGDRVALMLPTGLDFSRHFSACSMPVASRCRFIRPCNAPRSRIMRAAKPGSSVMRVSECSSRCPKEYGSGHF